MSIAISMPLEIHAEPQPVAQRAKRYLLPAIILSLVLHTGLLMGTARTPLPGSGGWAVESDELEINLEVLARPQWNATAADPMISVIRPMPTLLDAAGNVEKPGRRPIEGDPDNPDTVTMVNAADRIFTEIRQILWNYNKVMVVWCFDESPTMRPDRYRLASEIDSLYDRFNEQVEEKKNDDKQEQNEAEEKKGREIRRYDAQLLPPDAVITSVMSFGERIHLNTAQPTIDKQKISRAIRTIPTNESGLRRMCRAVIEGILTHKQFKQFNISKAEADRQRRGEGQGELTEEQLSRQSAMIAKLNEIFVGERKMIFILVTDEEGDLRSNYRYLDEAVRVATDENCRIYVLGREAVFGHPYAPAEPASAEVVASGLHVNVGTETARPEVLQADGLGRREDLFPAGFGPYEQSRLAFETGGVFFMCPPTAEVFDDDNGFHFADEKVLDRKQRMAASRAYGPSLVSRKKYDADLLNNELRMTVKTIVMELNPRDVKIFEDLVSDEDDDTSKHIVKEPLSPGVETQLRFDFPFQRSAFLDATTVPYRDAERLFIQYRRLLRWLNSLQPLRDEETDKRWQANYDLLRAEIAVLRARLYEYGVILRRARMEHPDWESGATRIKFTAFPEDETWTGAGSESLRYTREAKEILREVARNHPNTVWALRAKAELARGFGIKLVVY